MGKKMDQSSAVDGTSKGYRAYGLNKLASKGYSGGMEEIGGMNMLGGANFDDLNSPKKLYLLDFLATLEISILLYCRIVVLFIRGQEGMSSKLTAYSYL